MKDTYTTVKQLSVYVLAIFLLFSSCLHIFPIMTQQIAECVISYQQIEKKSLCYSQNNGKLFFS